MSRHQELVKAPVVEVLSPAPSLIGAQQKFLCLIGQVFAVLVAADLHQEAFFIG
jgi:hypothetical protein